VCGRAARKRSDRKFDFVDPHLICQSAVTPVIPTVAWTGNFVCWRLEGEDEDAFRARAHAECRAADPRHPIQVLIFGDYD
jgi:hypothetical protein